MGWLNDAAFLLGAEQFHEGGFIMVDEFEGSKWIVLLSTIWAARSL